MAYRPNLDRCHWSLPKTLLKTVVVLCDPYWVKCEAFVGKVGLWIVMTTCYAVYLKL